MHDNWYHFIPFVGAVLKGAENRHPPPVPTRIIELVIVAVVSAYTTNIKQDDKIDSLSQQVAQVQISLLKMQGDLYVPKAEVKK